MEIHQPKITVLMSVYNGEKYLKEAMDSVLSQTFTDFDFLIINDGSTDSSVEIIESYDDSRIKLIHNAENMGLVATLNKGFDLAEGQYIARMDCDDLSLPDRLAKQVAFMDANPDIGICGTWFQFIPEGQVVSHLINHEAMKVHLLINTPLGHPTVMMRTETLRQHNLYFDSTYLHAEDYELWVRMSRVTHMANIPEVLFHYRIHPEQISQKFSKEQWSIVDLIRTNQLEQLKLNPSEKELQLHLSLIKGHPIKGNDVVVANEWLQKLRFANLKTKIYDQQIFDNVLSGLLKEYYKISFTQKVKFHITHFTQWIKEKIK